MNILAFDTSSGTASVAVCSAGNENGIPLKEISQFFLKTSAHSTTLLPMIEAALKVCGLKYEDIGLICVSDGPGSFTGVRIGVSTAKGIAFSANIPCVGVSTLESLARGIRRDNCIIMPAIDARRNTVYTAAFLKKDGQTIRLSEDCQVDYVEYLEDAGKLHEEYPEYITVCTGDAFDTERNIPNGSIVVCGEERYPTGYGVAEAGSRQYFDSDNKDGFTEAALKPVYLKKTQAEREREERLGII